MNLGERIRSIRKQNKMTLKDIATETGFSISFLSQLERGKSSATLESLKKISIALKVSPSIFFDENDYSFGSSVEMDRLSKHNILYKSLHHPLENPIFQPLLVKLKPGQNEGNAFSHNGQEFLYVIKGTLTVLLNGKEITLKENDSIMFDSNQPHYWYNYTEQEIEFLCIAYDFD